MDFGSAFRAGPEMTKGRRVWSFFRCHLEPAVEKIGLVVDRPQPHGL
jgi:hypothetical protein